MSGGTDSMHGGTPATLLDLDDEYYAVGGLALGVDRVPLLYTPWSGGSYCPLRGLWTPIASTRVALRAEVEEALGCPGTD